MTVEFIPKKKDSICLGVTNKTWFWLLNNSDIGEIFNSQNTNDPIIADNNQALTCVKIMKTIKLPKNWSNGIDNEKMRSYFIEFFESCGGFTTY